MMLTPFWQSLDEKILRGVHHYAQPVLDKVILAITQGGDELALIIATILLALVLLWRYRRLHEALLYTLAAITSFVLNGTLKRIFERPRPQLWQQIIPLPRDYSFPSGHAMISMTVYGLAAWLLAMHFPQWRRAILIVAGLLILSIGGSRVYLGVHWPSDVLAGFFCGLLIVTASGIWHHKQPRSLSTEIDITQNK